MTRLGELGFDLPRRNIEDRSTGGSGGLLIAIENWAQDRPSRSEVIRRLIEIALASKTTGHKGKK
jgi:hypothetical protein